MRKLPILLIASAVTLIGCGSGEDQKNVDAAPPTSNASTDVKPNLNKNMPGAAGGPQTMESQPMKAPGK